MKNFVCVSSVSAGLIVAVGAMVATSRCHGIEVEGQEDLITVSAEWVNKNLPQPGQYLVRDGAEYSVMDAIEFDALFKCVGDDPLADPAPEVSVDAAAPSQIVTALSRRLLI